MQHLSWSQRKRVKTCARKRHHATWEAARIAGLWVWREMPTGRYANPPTPYPCSVLGPPHYHCGHINTGGRR